MISRSQTNQTSLPTDSRGWLAPVWNWLNNPLTFVFLVWGVLFLALGLIWVLRP